MGMPKEYIEISAIATELIPIVRSCDNWTRQGKQVIKKLKALEVCIEVYFGLKQPPISKSTERNLARGRERLTALRRSLTKLSLRNSVLSSIRWRGLIWRLQTVSNQLLTTFHQAVTKRNYKNEDMKQIMEKGSAPAEESMDLDVRAMDEFLGHINEDVHYIEECVLTSRRDTAMYDIACKICRDQIVERAYLPCGHAVTCVECSKVLQGVCPICRAPVEEKTRILLCLSKSYLQSGPLVDMSRLKRDIEKYQSLKECKSVKIGCNEVNTVFLPCGHALFCEDCAISFLMCPECGSEIQRKLRIYIC